MRKPFILALALAAVTALSACSSSHGAQVNPTQPLAYAEGKGGLDISVLRTAERDFPIYETPEQLATAKPIVAAGVIDGWQQGPILDSTAGPLDYRVVMRVRVTEPLKGVKGRQSIPDNLVFIELSQGAVLSQPNVPAKQWKPEKSVEDFEKALPVGTKVLVFPIERPVQELPMANPGAPLPANAQLMLLPPQGLILEDPQLAKQGATSGATSLVGGLEKLNVGGAGWLKYRDIQSLVDHLKAQGFKE
ncbi:hypothetical protein [Nonomuraea pusilla]|uniref:Uncharacterized protein n=1 Tax=Nonomuraea pusilla TaxID=46177 RepID=A0A1H8IHZ2_9ACTN|nr:hypothetical protein [Nonomuraea pusilla]SEN67836.1 hypothetical protein SAMN05660976_08058 [Nonomuraea pusilla]